MSKIRSEFPQTPLNLSLTEGQISVILYTLEEKVSELDNFDIDNKNEELREDIDSIFEVLETTVDKFYNRLKRQEQKDQRRNGNGKTHT